MNIDSLENSINSIKDSPENVKKIREDTKEEGDIFSKEEETGFHKGALNTLSAERNELVKMIGNVEAIMGAHAKRLKELGVELK